MKTRTYLKIGFGHDTASSALSARRRQGVNTLSGLGPLPAPCAQGRTRCAYEGCASFCAGRRCARRGNTTLGIPSCVPALPSAKICAIVVQTNFEIGSNLVHHELRARPEHLTVTISTL